MGIMLNENEKFLLEEIIKKNFSSKYKNSILGIFWSFLKPLLIMVLLTIIFSTLFSYSIDNFPVYYLSGKCLYDFFKLGTSSSMNSIKGNTNIIKRTATPKFIFVLGGIASEFINFIITLIILVAVMIVTNATFYFTSIFSIISILCLIMMIIGIGLILSIAYVYFSDIKHLYDIITLLLMYASAIFYPMEIIPLTFRKYMVLNPFYWIIDQFRQFVIFGNIPTTLSIINTFLISLIILVLGILIFKKYDKKVALKL